MDAFAPIPPKWTTQAVHAYQFCCPSCHASSLEAVQVWINRRTPVVTQDRRRKWQEFYNCQCGYVWWAWSIDRPPLDIQNSQDYHPT
ncbi:hypothetical protein [Umezakia ovalisporum]|jgi:hypothetical protein|uniref:Uncharacterized protein n=3 Tax=Umezakia ovalisporum TaxID=75695 RepID=A0AA43H0F7_9CYAN|nr:hypothetical protein [Umezakia ovalisporum]MBI1240079.1 hypothetical protein [Nostoc sp. RI_552]MDH6056991.1 hypothetical protein [Umezakia ovalisporum FSS-43]MDH6064443.1 hypothetical protein [Umezakia ovalisporum FSS-62]MDH6068441.1 hypothetical protein [Umezakia ovalisporum APH033B]MDH6071182.1 hypothetical protein [Umezakia ovalisporum CobakiLakeA]